jgi:hypothetical protein
MRKTLILLLLLLFHTILLVSIDESTLKKFEKAKIHKEKAIDIVRFEPMKPDIERYQKKTDTDISKGYFQLYKNNLRKANRIILNKWLKEFK